MFESTSGWLEVSQRRFLIQSVARHILSQELDSGDLRLHSSCCLVSFEVFFMTFAMKAGLTFLGFQGWPQGPRAEAMYMGDVKTSVPRPVNHDSTRHETANVKTSIFLAQESRHRDAK